MSRYIDADATRDLLIRSISLTNGIDTALDNAPSIDIVRCKECKRHNTHRCYMAFDLIATDADDFCSYGERSDNE